jgi:hypothetical protein
MRSVSAMILQDTLCSGALERFPQAPEQRSIRIDVNGSIRAIDVQRSHRCDLLSGARAIATGSSMRPPPGNNRSTAVLEDRRFR